MTEREELEFARIAIQLNYVTEEQVKKCLEVQKKLKKIGKSKSLPEIFKEVGLIRASRDWEKIHKMVQNKRKKKEALRFGEVAIELGIFSQKEFSALLEQFLSQSQFESFSEFLKEKYDFSEEVIQAIQKKLHQLEASDTSSLKALPKESSSFQESKVTLDLKSYAELRARQLQKRRQILLLLSLSGVFFLLLGVAILYLNYQKYKKASRLIRLGKYKEGADLLKTVKLWPGVNLEEVSRLWKTIEFHKKLQKAEALLEKHQWREAKAFLKKLEKNYPSYKEDLKVLWEKSLAEEWLFKAKEFLLAQKYEEAYQALKQAERYAFFPSQVKSQLEKLKNTLLNKAEQAKKKKQYQKALFYLALLDKLFQYPVKNQVDQIYFHLHLEKAKKLYQQGELEAAWRELQQAKEKAKDHIFLKDFAQFENFLRRRMHYFRLLSQLEKAVNLEEKQKILKEALTFALPRERRKLKSMLQKVQSLLRQKQREKKYKELMKKAIQCLEKSQIEEAIQTIQKALAMKATEEGHTLLQFAQKLKGMVFIPAGKFLQGSPFPGEGPPRVVELPPFFIDRFEVTNEQFLEFYKAKGYQRLEFWPNAAKKRKLFTDKSGALGPGLWNKGRFPSHWRHLPVVKISWYEARAYALFKGKKLPTESQWEKAARGGLPRKHQYPWGNQYKARYANVGRTFQGLEKVGAATQDKSPYGVRDMAGNVREWTRSLYLPYPGSQYEDYRFLNRRYRVVRGASFRTPLERAPRECRVSFRTGILPEQRFEDLGFRCVLEIPPKIWRIWQKYKR